MATTSSPAPVSATGLRKRFSYQWQLFLPLTVAMWGIVLGMVFWQDHNMKALNDARVREPLELVNGRIAELFETQSDPVPFINYICNYYRDNPLYEKLCISVYRDGHLLYNNGQVIPRESAEAGGDLVRVRREHANYFYKGDFALGKRVEIYSMMPFDDEVESVLDDKQSDVWWIVILLVLSLTIGGYISTRYFGRNIKLLRTFAEKAATSPDFIPSADYPHDELGDISRQITRIYKDRLQAMKRQQQEHEVAMHAMEEKARMKRQLTNNINHELKTPIGVIKGYLDTIIDTPDMDEESRNHFLMKARQHADRLAQLVNDVTAISRLQDGGSLINLEDVDFHDVVYTVCSDAVDSGTIGSLQFENEVRPGLHIRGNFNLLTAMLMNLVRNAVAYSHGTTCGVRLTKEDENYYHFEFFDDGRGVGEEHLAHLFERFYRVDAGRSRKEGGTGLGLPIVQSTIEAHGGKIEVFNRDGLIFSFTLPKPKFKEEHPVDEKMI